MRNHRKTTIQVKKIMGIVPAVIVTTMAKKRVWTISRRRVAHHQNE
jgi:hypothetical protein